MGKGKRMTVATLSGVLFGFVCYWFVSSGAGDVAWPIALQTVLSRTLIGVAIGISSVRMRHWSIHGVVMGLIFSLPLSFGSLMAPESPEYTRAGLLIGTLVLGMIYGFLIEVITSLVFKARMRR